MTTSVREASLHTPQTSVLPDVRLLHCIAPVPLESVSIVVFEANVIVPLNGAARQKLTPTPDTIQHC